MMKKLLLTGAVFAFSFAFNLTQTKNDKSNFLVVQISKYMNTHNKRIDQITRIEKTYPKGRTLVVNLSIDDNSKDLKGLHGHYEYLKESLESSIKEKFCKNGIIQKVLAYNVIFDINYFLKHKKKKVFSIVLDKNSCKKTETAMK